MGFIRAGTVRLLPVFRRLRRRLFPRRFCVLRRRFGVRRAIAAIDEIQKSAIRLREFLVLAVVDKGVVLIWQLFTAPEHAYTFISHHDVTGLQRWIMGDSQRRSARRAAGAGGYRLLLEGECRGQLRVRLAGSRYRLRE